MRKANIWMAVFLMAIGLLVLYDSIRLGFRWDPVSGPGAGFLPFYLALGTIICTAFVLVKGIKKLKAEGAGKPLIPEGGLKPILWVLIPSSVMVILITPVGLHIAAFIFLAFYMRAVGKIEWSKIALVSILIPFSLYIIFDRLFLIPLPQGWLGDYLPQLPLPF
jgi:hypothetical protein